jgi:hypothetical protein
MEVVLYSPNFYLHLQDAVVFIQVCIQDLLMLATKIKI